MKHESFDARSVMSEEALAEQMRIVRIVMEAHEKAVAEEREKSLKAIKSKGKRK